jgi:hypothetical protein
MPSLKEELIAFHLPIWFAIVVGAIRYIFERSIQSSVELGLALLEEYPTPVPLDYRFLSCIRIVDSYVFIPPPPFDLSSLLRFDEVVLTPSFHQSLSVGYLPPVAFVPPPALDSPPPVVLDLSPPPIEVHPSTDAFPPLHRSSFWHRSSLSVLHFFAGQSVAATSSASLAVMGLVFLRKRSQHSDCNRVSSLFWPPMSLQHPSIGYIVG